MNSNNLKNKIQSNKGATIVFALVALIVCVMISAVVIYTAFSNVGRVKNTQDEEQNYLSVGSAVMLFKDSLYGESISFEEKRETITTEIYENNWETTPVSSNTIEQPPAFVNISYNENKILIDVLKEWVEIDSPLPQTLDITIAGNDNLPNIADVEAEMVFDPGNNKLTITFCIKNASPSDVDKYGTVMTMDLSKSVSEPVTSSKETKEQIEGRNVKTITVTKIFVHTISWDNCVITKKEANTGG